MEASASIFSHKGSKMAVRRRHSSFLNGTELLNWFTKNNFIHRIFHHFSLCKCFCLYFFSNYFRWDQSLCWDSKHRGRSLRLRKIKHSSSQSTVNQNKNVNNLKTAPKKLQQEKCNLPFFLRIILLLILEFQGKEICLIFCIQL